jgi:sugar-phosphatase
MHILKNHLKAIIFDMDGTIINSALKWANAVSMGIDAFCRTVSAQEKDAFVLQLNGGGLYQTANKIKSFFKIKQSVREIADKIKQIAHADFARGVGYIEGFQLFQSLLAEYSIKHGIATNADLQSFDKLIDAFGFQQMFGEHLYCIDHIGGVAKPDPAIFLHAAKNLGVAPQDCIVFEDSFVGFQAAKAAGMRCIAIKNEKNAQYFHMVDGAINSYHEAIEALYKLVGLAVEDKPKIKLTT